MTVEIQCMAVDGTVLARGPVDVEWAEYNEDMDVWIPQHPVVLPVDSGGAITRIETSYWGKPIRFPALLESVIVNTGDTVTLEFPDRHMVFVR